MIIAFIGKFSRLYDEEYIARSFEMLGHTVVRIGETLLTEQIIGLIEHSNPDLVLFTKFSVAEPDKLFKYFKDNNLKTVCWLFDLYWGYAREYRIKTAKCFKADYVFTTDGGNDEKWKALGINHHCVRQGIFKDECKLLPAQESWDVVFVGSENGLYPYRAKLLTFIDENYDLNWYGRLNTHEKRGMELNELYCHSAIVIGDSVFSPHYWSNRVVETLGRGGFLIHPDVPGISEEYPHLVTYKYGDFKDLKEKIDYYLENEDERNELVKKNFEFVKKNYTMDKKCAELLSML